jgi:hypothetical protein
VINPETAGKDRARLVKAVALALRQLMLQTETDHTTRDMAAFIALALDEIERTVDPTVLAWEKRDYWVKADRFRMEWAWAGRLGKTMRQAVLTDDWASVARTAGEVAMRVQTVKLPVRHRLGEPWQGAFKKLKEQ